MSNTENIGDGRAIKVCDLCGQVDDHPKHVISGGIDGTFPAPSDKIVNAVIAAAPSDQLGRLMRDLLDTTSSDRHIDCCAAAGCPTGTCAVQAAGAPGTGLEMLEHIQTLPDPFGDRDDVVQAEAVPEAAPVNTLTESGDVA